MFPANIVTLTLIEDGETWMEMIKSRNLSEQNN
jgi:hypothetical protein